MNIYFFKNLILLIEITQKKVDFINTYIKHVPSRPCIFTSIISSCQGRHRNLYNIVESN